MQLPCDEFLWNADKASDWIKGFEGQQEYDGFLQTLKIFLDCRRQPPALSPLCCTLVLHGLISIGLDLQERSSSDGSSQAETAAKQDKLLQGFEVWRRQFVQLGQILVEPWYERIMAMYHIGYIVLHTSIHNLLAVAGDRRLSARNVNDYYRVKQEMQQWASLPSAQIATWHSLRILLPYLSRPQVYSQELYVTWCTYVATLVCWAYGHLSPPPLDANGLPEVTEEEDFMWDPYPDMRMYLEQMDTATWQRLGQVRLYKSKTGGLLSVVSSAMESTRWGLVKESHEILKRLHPTRSARGV
ncbi:hypothetical protein EDC01DRAFT_74948 [Geopyxis carbonaria]|nr:hypothetical protein EDC01DRAFT_74948 [Geopyxis carbonaria]